MSDLNLFESDIADQESKRFLAHQPPNHAQVVDPDIAEPYNTASNSARPGQAENAQRSTSTNLLGLKVDQNGMVWGPNGSLLGKVQDDGPVKLEELKTFPLDEKRERFDEDGQKIGPALALDTSSATRFTSVREHPFYKMRPDKNGRYYCPYTASEDCWYRPQKLKFKFNEHLDTHLKPYRCNSGQCVDVRFSSADSLLCHEAEVHNVPEYGIKPHILHSRDGVEPSKETSTSFFKTPPTQDAATHRLPERSKVPRVHSFQSPDLLIHMSVLDKEDVFPCGKGAHVVPPPPAPPAKFCRRTPSLKSTDNVESECISSLYTAFESNHSVASKPWIDPNDILSIPKTVKIAHPKEEEKNIIVGVDFLHKLESKISDLQSRVEECEGRPSSPTNSSISESHDSEDSISDLSDGSIRDVRDSRHLDDDIIIFEPEEVKQEKRVAVKTNPPILALARLKYICETQLFEVVEQPFPCYLVGGAKGYPNRPLLTIIEDHCSNKLWQKRLEIASPAFYELLMEVSCHNLNLVALSHDGILHLMEPFMSLFLNRKQLADYVKNSSELSQAKVHAEFILNFLGSEFGDISRMLDNFESVTPPNLVRYCDLWMLYRPGTTVYSHANGEWEAFVIDCLDGMHIRRPSPENLHALTRLDVCAWSVNVDGEIYGRVWSLHCVAPFHGVKDISSLPLVPEKFLMDRDAVKKSLISRGKRFCSFQGQHCQTSDISPSKLSHVMVDHLTYQRRNGWLISVDGKYEPSGPKEWGWKESRYSEWTQCDKTQPRPPRRYIPQRSLVRPFEEECCNWDYELESIDKPADTQAEACRSYFTDRPFHVVVREFEKYNSIGSAAEMDELSLMLCPQHVRAFCFQDKLWKFLNVSQLYLLSLQEEAWDRLVIDEEYKNILETMVLSHFKKVNGFSGGKGLSILLNGGSGVGKTLTAESIAEYFGKPLFPVACSDLGTSVTYFEERLEEISDYATKWGAILLFDEADVLLQARRDYECANLKRNDLVSSFVRFIKYYQGVVFITTNRVHRFEGTLMPLIDISLGLPPLDSGRRVKIWYNQIDGLVHQGAINASQSADLRSCVSKWSRENINGHQIKKVVQTASVFAETKGITLSHVHIEMVLKMEREFEKSVGRAEKESQKEKEEEAEKGKGKEKKAERKSNRDDFDDFEQVEKP